MIEYAILGLGKTGFSCACYLHQQGHRVIVMDSRQHPPYFKQLKLQCPDIEIIVGGFNQSLLQAAKQLVISPGVPLQDPMLAKLIASGKPVTNDVELFLSKARAPIVAVTGSNGKSTVVKLLEHICKQSGVSVLLGGNIGTPVLDLLNEPTPQFIILELSSFQLMSIQQLNAYSAVVLNITPDHLDWHQDFEEYKQAKLSIYQGCQHPVLRSESGGFDCDGLHYDCYEGALYCQKTLIMHCEALPYPEQHFVDNTLAVFALAKTMGVSFAQMAAAMPMFQGLPHRCEVVLTVNQVTWIDDSKATNIGACISAVESVKKQYSGRIFLILSGMSKGVDLTPLKRVLQNHVACLLLLGEAVANFTVSGVETYSADAMPDIIAFAKAQARPGDVVLLSPAGASFDMFKDYAHRGDVFKQAVKDSYVVA